MMHILLISLTTFLTGILAIDNDNSYKYAAELERGVIKPRACGSYYFENLQDAFLYNFRGPMVSEPLKIADFCEKFSTQYNVTLNILDQNGIDQCIYRNPVANLFTTFLTALNRRNATDRLEFYENIDTSFAIPGLLNYTTDPDVIGLFKFYFQVFIGNTDEQALEAIYENIYNITQYPDAGPQYVPVIMKQTDQSNIMASLSSSDLRSVLSTFANNAYQNVGPAIANDILLLILLLFGLINSVNNQISIGTALQQEIVLMLKAVGTFGMAKNQAIPLTTNLIQNGICYLGFNHVSHTGVMYRIVFSQSKSTIITIKK